jgi:hypothetical protein
LAAAEAVAAAISATEAGPTGLRCGFCSPKPTGAGRPKDQEGALSGLYSRGNRLQSLWSNGHAGTSPVVAGGLLYVYDPGGGLRVYNAATGNAVTTLASGGGHWNSPIVVDRRIALPEGNANDHLTSGVLDIWRVP